MQRLFFFLLTLSSLCIIFLPLLSVIEAVDVHSCEAASKSLLCANLKNISYPFGDMAPCAASDSFRLSNCSGAQAYWEPFTEALGKDDAKLGAPAVMGIIQYNGASCINLAWNIPLLQKNACEVRSTNLAHSYVPADINLTSFANGSFQVSHYNKILLLNCRSLPSSLAPSVLLINSTTCHDYQEVCNVLQNTSCAEIVVPTKKLALLEKLERYSCSHFQLLVSDIDEPTPISSWEPGLVQLFYDTKCEACIISNGACVWNKSSNPPTFQGCICRNNKFSDTDCYSINGCKRLCSTGARIAVGVASTVVATVIVMMLAFWMYYRKGMYSTKSFSSASSNRLITQRAYMLSKKFGPVWTKEFSFESLSKATKSFADENMIGDGGFGAVYLGILKDGRKVAIKRLYHDNFKRMDHFYNEIQILSKLHHQNLVKLYGFCCQDSRDLLLVFEYASNGTVSDQLHDVTKPAMSWKIRLNIARETAEALSYLHNEVNPPIYHRDVKTTNILLDDDLHAKLADFGLSRLVPLEATHVSTAPQGTPGYLDPDYHQCYRLTDKSDVYSFGVVLVELVSAKLAVDMSRDRREINLSNLALMKIGCGQWEDLVDPRLEMKKNPDVEKMVKRVIELAFMCLHAEKDSRPTMKYIAETLASMCKEWRYGHDDDYANGMSSFKVDMNTPMPADETSQLIKSNSASKFTFLVKSKSSSKSTRSVDSPPSSADWISSNASSYEKSF